MMTALAIAVTASPLLAIVGLLSLRAWIERRRQACHTRQIELTDAIHRELGAVAAPTVSRRRGGGWLVSMMLPLERPGTVMAVLSITERVLGSDAGDGNGPLQILLTPRPSGAARAAVRPGHSIDQRRPVAA